MAQEIYHRSEWGNPNEQWGNVYLNADLTNELYKRASEYENSWVTDQLLNGVGIKPSIILTPTAYEDGILNSVKPQKTFGSELVTNGGFDTNTNWTKGVGWTISGGAANFNTTSNSSILQNLSITSGKKYRIQITGEITSGALKLTNGSGLGNDAAFAFTLPLDVTYTHDGGANTIEIRTIGASVGYLDNVSVKEVIDADFDFTRGSSATRVNEQGLIQDVQILSGNLVQNGDFEQIGSEQVSNGDFEQIGSELVVNGDFSDSSWWGLDPVWSISNGSANCIGSGTIYKGGVLTIGKTYKVQVEISSYTSGTLTYPNASYTLPSAVGSYTFYYKANSQTISFTGTSFTGSIDNVSVKEVGQDWITHDDWSIGDGVAIANNSSSYIKQNNVVTNGNITQSGTYTFYIKPTTSINGGFEFIGNSFTGSIDNVSVKEVGQNWSVANDDANNYVEFNQDEGTVRLKFLNTSPITELVTSFIMTAGKKYKLTVDVALVTSGSIKIDGAGISETFNTSGITTRIINPTGSTVIKFYRASADVDITLNSVSLIEITDDTDLPRINYTNFDYENGEVVPYSGEGSLLLEPQSTNLITYSEDLMAHKTQLKLFIMAHH
jgi:hypothetical protein